jgi:hypothetical protein
MSDQGFNVLNDFPPEKYNLLVPVQSVQEVNPIYRLVVNTVVLSTATDDKDIYEEKNAGAGMYALTHKALLKLFTAANGQIVESTRIRTKVCEKCIDIVKATGKAPACGTCPASSNVACRVTIKIPELSGGWRLVQATRDMDFSAMGHLKEGQVRQMKTFAFEHAESKALSRCIRKGFSIKSAYSLAELEKPFIVVYPVLDARDADVKKALIAGSIMSSNLLYGSGLMLNAGQNALPEGRKNIDMSTGEIIDAGYEAGEPECEEQPKPEEAPKPWVKAAEPEKYYCSNPACKAEIAKNIYDASVAKFGAAACTKCQNDAKKGGK